MTTTRAPAAASTTPSTVGAVSTGWAATPASCCTTSDAVASSLLASRRSTAVSAAAPHNASGAPAPVASQAPSSSALQSSSRSAEGHDDGAGRRRGVRVAGHEQRDVARRAVELRGELLIERAGGRLARVEEQEVDVLLRGEPDDVRAAVVARERGRARGQALFEQCRAARLQPAGLLREPGRVGSRQQADDDQLVRAGRAGERRGEREQRLELPRARAREEDRPRRRLHPDASTGSRRGRRARGRRRG